MHLVKNRQGSGSNPGGVKCFFIRLSFESNSSNISRSIFFLIVLVSSIIIFAASKLPMLFSWFWGFLSPHLLTLVDSVSLSFVSLILFLIFNSCCWQWFWLHKLFWSCPCEMAHDVFRCFVGIRLWYVCYFHKFVNFCPNFKSDPIWSADKFCYCWLSIWRLLFGKVF